jgi:RNA-directed DNA polymerase
MRTRFEKSANGIVVSPDVWRMKARISEEDDGFKDSNGMERRKEMNDRQLTFIFHEDSGERGTQTGPIEEPQVPAAFEKTQVLTKQMMEQVVGRSNLNDAYKRVKANGGAPGIDGMTTGALYEWLIAHREELTRALLNGTYKPQPVRRVEIPKPGGGIRKLGIPTVVDRLVQQAILQILDPILDVSFSESSYGFRRKRSAEQALKVAAGYVRDGRVIVVDLDLEQFFDRVNHDILMSRLARRVADKRLLRIVRAFLTAGIMVNGVCIEQDEGTPQGGPLSPLLANLLLDDLDKELEKRGHRFCRYADDCNIYVQSKAAGERVMSSVIQFLEQRLKLRVNRAKSAVAYCEKREFLRYRLLAGGKLGLAPQSLKRIKDKIRRITKRNRGRSVSTIVQELNDMLPGWVNYFRHAAIKGHLFALDEWVRRKLRCYRLKQRKRGKSIGEYLITLGLPPERVRLLAGSGKGWWVLSGTPPAHETMNGKWFEGLGLVNMSRHYAALSFH